MQTRSHAHIECIINGHRVTGWAEDDPPYEFEEDDMVELKTGQDGGRYGLSIPNLGGKLTLKLAHAAPSTQWGIQQKQLFKNNEKDGAAQRIYSGSLTDSAARIGVQLAGGVFVNCPSFPVANQTFELVFDFEELTSDVDGGVFHPPLTSDPSS